VTSRRRLSVTHHVRRIAFLAGTAIGELITLVNIALGSAQPSACAHGVPDGAAVDIALLIRAVNNALSGCSASAQRFTTHVGL
jgi:hypothetical protein